MCRVVSENVDQNCMNDFLENIKAIYLKKTFPRIDFCRVRHGPSLLLYEVTRYFIQMRRTKLVMKMLKNLAETDSQVFYYIVEILMSQGNHREALTLLAEIVRKNPVTVYFLI